MRKLAVNGPSASSTGPKTAVNIIGATTIRPLVSQIIIGVQTDPNATDQHIEFAVGNTTAAGTAGSSPTPKPLDPQDVAGQCTAGITHSGEPTYGATYFIDNSINQRGGFTWTAETGFEIAGSATASNGIGIKEISVTAAMQLGATIHYKE
jgi:hypothetical protein